MNYYNEIDPYAAQWLRNLVKAGRIPNGYVDERSIEDIKPDELKEYTQCHFFAGIAGWPLALRLAGWPDDKSVWTGSCPCQPFSSAGKGAGFADKRHLWPAWYWLIEQCKPAAIFGEQVAAGIAKNWLDLVSHDLETLGYAFGSVALPACSVGAPHIRQRTWWLAESGGGRYGASKLSEQNNGSSCRAQEEIQKQRIRSEFNPVCSGELSWLAESNSSGPQQGSKTTAPAGYGDSVNSNGWDNIEWLECRDGKQRPTQPGVFPLAYGVSGRVGRLRAYGNAIVPQIAAEFIKASFGRREIHIDKKAEVK
jgi:DNA (cytosine-5)-methyltransferase 1